MRSRLRGGLSLGTLRTPGLIPENAFRGLRSSKPTRSSSAYGGGGDRTLCSLTYVSDSFPFPDPSSFRWDNLDRTFGLKHKRYS